MFSAEERARLRKYMTILELISGKLSMLTPWEQRDLKQLLEKWRRENYG